MTASRWYSASVIAGDKTGSRYVYPTVNFDPAVLPAETKRGVYASRVKIGGTQYQGALFFGPRLVKGEAYDVLEVYLLDFSGTVTDTTAEFSLAAYIREVQDFSSLEMLRQQVTKDIAAVRKALNADKK